MIARSSTLLVAAVATLAFNPSHVAAQTTEPDLAGRVVNAGTSEGVPGLTVELHRVTQEAGALIDSVTAGADGGFQFELSVEEQSDEASTVWIAAARYQGILYFGEPVHAGMTRAGPYEIPVYDTVAITEPVSHLVTDLRHVVMSGIPDHAGVIQVAEIVDIVQDDSVSFVGAEPSTIVWEMPLPSAAMQASVLEGGLPEDVVVFEPGRVGILGPLPPPGARLAIQYVVPADEFEIEIAHATRSLDVLADQASGRLEVSGLETVEAPDVPGSAILRFAGTELAPGTRITVRAVKPRAPSRTAPWVWMVAALVLFGAAGLATRLRPGERAS